MCGFDDDCSWDSPPFNNGVLDDDEDDEVTVEESTPNSILTAVELITAGEGEKQVDGAVAVICEVVE